MKLNRQPLAVKVLISGFLFSLLVGFGISVFQIHDRTGFSVAKTVVHYRGVEGGSLDGELHLPPTYQTLLSVAHVHTMSQPVMFFLVGFLFVGTALSERLKIFFIVLLFGSSLLSNASPWLVRYLSVKTVVLFPLSASLMIGLFLLMSGVIFYDLWRSDDDSTL
ncbi:MAG: hypothetical protein HYS22_00905 [Deltaproteobacteria bacterium]|nr:hypothetical protein [Deltaproteobacteria bacterium]